MLRNFKVTYRTRNSLVLLAVLVGMALPGIAAPARIAPAQAAESIYFNDTRQALSDEHRFLSYWKNNGGLAQFGYPITGEILEVNPADQKTYIVQWFERNRFEWHPELKGTRYEVLLGLLGRQLTIGREQEAPFKPVGNPRAPGFNYYPETGHTLANTFREYWERNGGLAIYGFPVTEEFDELSQTDGKTYTTQYFERARFEYHPEFKGTKYEVLLGLLGNQVVGGPFYPDVPPNILPGRLEVPDRYRSGSFATERKLNLPPGFKLNLFVGGLTDARLMALAPNGDIFVTERNPYGNGKGRVRVVRDADRDGVAENAYIFADELEPFPHGIAFYGNYLYVALETKVIRFEYQTGQTKAAGLPQTVINDLPEGQTGVLNGHNTRTIIFGPDGKMYVSIGSSCDACIETNPYRASIWQFNPDGSQGRPYAVGLRNAVAIGFDPGTNLLWTAVNGRNRLGDDFPPEQLTPLRDGGNYGWPFCVGNNPPQPDPDFGGGKADFCANQVDRALLSLPAHSAPLGLTFYTGQMFPPEYRGGLFVVQHGSFPGERSTVYGDGVRFVSMRPGKLQQGAKEVVSGWINPDKKGYWGRPVAPLTGADGALYISDDNAGAIYRLSYAN